MGDFVLLPNSARGFSPPCKIYEIDFVLLYINEQGGFCPGGILYFSVSMTDLCRYQFLTGYPDIFCLTSINLFNWSGRQHGTRAMAHGTHHRH